MRPREKSIAGTKVAKKFTIQRYQHLLEQTGGATRENLFEIVGKIEDTFGCVPEEVICDLALRTGLSKTQIYGALTSYKDFRIQP